MPEAVIVDAVRTPIGKRNGSLADVHPADLSAHVLCALQQRTGIDPLEIDDVIWGCVNQVGDQAAQIGRYAVLAAGWPEDIAGITLNRACGSSQSAFDFGAALVRGGHYDVVVAGGVETMSRVPLGAGRELGRPFGPLVRKRYESSLTDGPFPNNDFNQGIGAEMIARRWAFTRERLDAYSVRSHARAAAAIKKGALDDQLAPVPGKPDLRTDECVRPTSTMEGLATLKPSFREHGVIHAGNASQISDGASATLITTPEKARELGLTPIARYHTGTVAGSDPLMMLTGVIPATHKLLKRSGVALSDIGVFEVNEAFAPVPMAWQAEFGVSDDLLNPLGGAIATGHPLGASGTILMTRMLHHMRDNGIRFGLQTMCEGGGTANATLVELIG